MRNYFKIIIFIIIVFSIFFYYCKKNENEYLEEYRIFYNNILANNLVYIERTNKILYTEKEYGNKLPKDRAPNNAPDWIADIDNVEGLSKLPLPGWTMEELMNAQNENEGDVAIEIMCRLTSDSLYELFQQRKKWLEKAISANRSGADFILRVVQEQERQLPEKKEIELSDIPGYSYFISLLHNGDYKIFKALVRIQPSILKSSLRFDIEQHLEKRARNGDFLAARYLGDLRLVLEPEIFPGMPIKIDREKFGSIDKYVTLVSPGLGRQLKEEMYKIASPEWRQKLYTAYLLKQSADQGDIESMFIWIDSGIAYYAFFDKDAWSDIFEYSDFLIKKGHNNYLRSIKFTPRFINSDFLILPYSILQNYYSDESQNIIHQKIDENLKKRGDLASLANSIIKYDANLNRYICADDISIINIQRVNNMDSVFLTQKHVYSSLLQGKQKISFKEYVFQLIKNTAVNGCPEAEVALADIIKQGWVVHRNDRESCRLLERAWEKSSRYNTSILLSRTPVDSSLVSLSSIVVENLMLFYASPDLETYNPDKASALALSYYQMDDAYGNANLRKSNYYMGFIHENGIGVQKSTKKAIYYYRQGDKKGELFSRMELNRFHKAEIDADKNYEESNAL